MASSIPTNVSGQKISCTNGEPDILAAGLVSGILRSAWPAISSSQKVQGINGTWRGRPGTLHAKSLRNGGLDRQRKSVLQCSALAVTSRKAARLSTQSSFGPGRESVTSSPDQKSKLFASPCIPGACRNNQRRFLFYTFE
jgi:hypothetical protein